MSANETVARDKLVNPRVKPNGETPPSFPIEDLPNSVDDPVWNAVAIDYQLSLPELSALKKAVVSSTSKGDNQLLKRILDNQNKSTRLLASLSKVIVHDSCPRAPSGRTERSHHRAEMKQNARVRYQCEHSTDPSQTKCMLLGLFFQTNRIVNSHIISVRNRNALARLGLPDECLWDAKNCFLLFDAFEEKLERLEVTFLLNPNTQTYSFQVLYDDLLPNTIPVPASELFPGRNGNLSYADLNGRPLSLPPLVFPYRRCQYFMSYYAYLTAMHSKRPHSCAEASNPTEEAWEEIKKNVASDSDCGDELAFFSLSDEENEIEEAK